MLLYSLARVGLANTFNHHNMRHVVRWNRHDLPTGHGYDAFGVLCSRACYQVVSRKRRTQASSNGFASNNSFQLMRISRAASKVLVGFNSSSLFSSSSYVSFVFCLLPFLLLEFPWGSNFIGHKKSRQCWPFVDR